MDPLIGAAGIGALGNIVGGLFGSSGADKAAEAQEDALRTFRKFANRAITYQEPYRAGGQRGFEHLLDALGLGNSEAAVSRFENSPLYRVLFGDAVDDARNDVLSTASSRGMLNSGSTLRALTDARAKTARGFLGDYIAGLGDVATRGQNAATTTGNILVGQGSAAMQGGEALGNIALAKGLGIGNAISGGAGDLASILGMKSAQRGASLYGGTSGYELPNLALRDVYTGKLGGPT